jgi:nucleotide-binding universal stress UspA family protein
MKVLIAIEDTCQSIVDFIFKHKWHPGTEFYLVKVVEPLMVGHVHSVLPSPVIYDMMADARKEAASSVRHVALKLRDKFHSTKIYELVEEGLPGQTIVDLSRSKNIDLIVMATHGRRGFERFVLGSVSHWVAAHAPCEVLIVNPQEAADSDDATSSATNLTANAKS